MVGPDFQGVCVLLKLPSVGIMCSFSIILYILVNENLEIAVKNGKLNTKIVLCHSRLIAEYVTKDKNPRHNLTKTEKIVLHNHSSQGIQNTD